MKSRNLDRQARGLLALNRRATGLKAVPRTGWLDRGVDPQNVESVADHALGVALLTWACALERRSQGEDLDPSRAVVLALIHDLAEAETGDSPPYHPAAVPAAEDPAARRAFLDRRHIRGSANESVKQANEDTAMQKLLDEVPASVQSDLREFWRELRQGTSPEARLVKQVDRLETFLQSRHYLSGAPDLPMDSFRREVMETIDDPLLAAIRDAALTEHHSGHTE